MADCLAFSGPLMKSGIISFTRGWSSEVPSVAQNVIKWTLKINKKSQSFDMKSFFSSRNGVLQYGYF